MGRSQAPLVSRGTLGTASFRADKSAIPSKASEERRSKLGALFSSEAAFQESLGRSVA
jgi:hypothetical protein